MFSACSFICLVALSAVTFAANASAAGLTARALRCEYLSNPIGVDEPRPRLSWTLTSDQRGARQTAYQVIVASSVTLLEAGRPDLWDSGQVASAEQNQIEYAGKALASRQQCVWRVRAWDAAGQPGPWSETATWEVGLREPADWQAQWIGDGKPRAADKLTVLSAVYESIDHQTKKDVTAVVAGKISNGQLKFTANNETLGGDPARNQHKQLALRYAIDGGAAVETIFREGAVVQIPLGGPQVLRRAFKVGRPVVRARLYATALGAYELRLNGHPVTDAVFTPDWTDYRKRVRYQAYDVTALVRQGANVMAGSVADGFYSGHIGNGAFRFYGSKPAMMAQLELTHEDGTIERIATDAQWQSHAGPLGEADVMLGESHDARLAFEASDPALADDGAWVPVELRTNGLPPVISAQIGPPVRELMTLAAKSVKEPQPGHWLFDLGQNMVGVERLKLTAPAGTAVTVRFAEMLNPDGTLYTANYRGARSIDTYVCRGGGEEVWQPQFTYHGFRYVELTGLPGRPDLDAVVGVVQGSDTPSVGTFECSDPRLNQLWSNIRWGQRGNFFGVPTDCPQRDERLGWTGDAQVFIGTAVYNADVASFFTKWLVDLDDEQSPHGQYPNTAPNAAPPSEIGAPAWADAGVICPWVIYQTYGDKRQLAQHLPGMMRWVDLCKQNSTDLIRDKGRGSDFGDWLSIGADTSKELLGTAYFAHSADLVARSAKALGDEANAKKYEDLFREIKVAFRERYIDADGSIKNGTQTAYALALAFDLLSEADRPAAAERLAADVKAKGDHLSTGFVGVSYLLPALSRFGQTDVAYRLLMQDTFPSWLFSISHGATTIWERWDGWTPDKGFQDAGMNSFNHYSLGSCGQWMYERMAGIAQPAGGTGFARVDVRPLVGGGGLTRVAATYDSPRGPVRVAWKLESGRVTLDVAIPPNVTATVRVPTATPAEVYESGRPAESSESVRLVLQDESSAIVEIGSGTYQFTAAAPR